MSFAREGYPLVTIGVLLAGLAWVGVAASIGGPCLYVTGEESVSQIKMRADRLGLPGTGLYLLQATELTEVMAELDKRQVGLVVVDSIQTLFDSSESSTSGSVTQIRQCTRVLMEWAKRTGVPVLLTGHVTKGGDIAGPRVLEHIVDGFALASLQTTNGIKSKTKISSYKMIFLTRVF
mgnify:CR=1 FL=1